MYGNYMMLQLVFPEFQAKLHVRLLLLAKKEITHHTHGTATDKLTKLELSVN